MHYSLTTGPGLDATADVALDVVPDVAPDLAANKAPDMASGTPAGAAAQPGSASVTLEGRIHSISLAAEGIFLLDIRPVDDQPFPAATPGAHIDLHLPNGMVRSYSTVNSPEDTGRYLIAVKNEAAGRGGSRLIHAELRVGQVLPIGGPRNNFTLREDAAHSVLIAGGIGITPIYSMVQRLQRQGRSWELHYAAADPRHAAFAAQLRTLQPRVRFYFNSEQARGQTAGHQTEDGQQGDCLLPGCQPLDRQPLDLHKLIADSRADADFYCCGPQGMLAAFATATAAIDPARVHAEYFSAVDAPAAEGGFEVVLQQSGKRCHVQRGETILDAVLKLGVDVPYSCMEGVCGSCEARVLEGTPDHRDLILSKAERQMNDRMMICCSGSHTARLILDL